MTTAQAIWTCLGALLVGALLPVLVQLFLTLRLLKRTVATIEQPIERLTAVANRVSAPATTSLVEILAAAVPAVLAGVQAFRAHRADVDAAEDDDAAAVASAGAPSPLEPSTSPAERKGTSREPLRRSVAG